jgi:biopolymer transport protein ExbD
MAMSGGKDDGTPMMEINTTPLIDVMLVLLIMFIITIPVATHSIDIDLPSPPPPDQPKPPVDPIKNKVSITRDAEILWNDQPITNAQLVANLQESLTLPVEPELQFQPDADAPYDVAAKVMNVIKITKVTKFGFVGNEQYAYFGKGE